MQPEPETGPVASAAPRSDSFQVAETGALLEHSRTRWQFGDWADLAGLDRKRVEADPDRAKLMLLVAAAHSHVGDIPEARIALRTALSWGADRKLAARVMLSAAENSLGRVATALEDDQAQSHFEAAIRLVEPRADVSLLARTRLIRESARMGLLSDAAAALEKEFAPDQNAPQSADAARKRLEQDVAVVMRALGGKRHETARPRTIVVAGVPRSGSTWVYNAVRRLLETGGQQVYAAWCGDYKPQEHAGQSNHVVKVHNPEQLTFPHDIIVTTNRDLKERLASLIRMGWLKRDEAVIRNTAEGQRKLYDFWAARSDLEIGFETIMKRPERAVAELAAVLKVPCNARTAQQVSTYLAQLQSPEEGGSYDPVTLIHPHHRSDLSETAEIAQWIGAVLDAPQQ